MIGFYNYTVILTYLSLCSAVCGVCSAMSGHAGIAVICLFISGFTDAFDGKVARMRKKSTDEERRNGIQLDSLCDIVSFGVLPICIGYAIGMKSVWYIPVFCLYSLTALVRLAYFNVTEEDRQSKTTEVRKFYTGMPVTTVSIIIPLFYMITYFKGANATSVFTVLYTILAVLFVIKIQIKKPGLRGVLIMVFLGMAELILILLLKFNVIG